MSYFTLADGEMVQFKNADRNPDRSGSVMGVGRDGGETARARTPIAPARTRSFAVVIDKIGIAWFVTLTGVSAQLHPRYRASSALAAGFSRKC